MTNCEQVGTLIIGAGPAGLTTAYCLGKSGESALVLERDPVYVGGISRTVNYKGFLFDIGGHRFFSKSRAVNDLWDEILPVGFIDRPRLSRIYYGGKFYTYPLKAFEALANLGPREAIVCMLSFGWARLFPVRSPKTFHQWVRNRFGERLFGIFFKTYTEKVWGMSCDEISADWATQRIQNLSLGRAVLDGLTRSLGLSRGSDPSSKTLLQTFRYPRRGPGMMWEACAAKIEAMGGEVRLGARVTGLEWNENTALWTVTYVDGDGASHAVTASRVVSSAPLRELVEAISPAPKSLPEAMDLSYRDFLTVVLISRSRIELEDNWIYIHDPSVRLGRVQNFRSWSPDMIPDGVSTCLGLEYFCFEGDALWSMTDDDLIALARKEIAAVGLMAIDDITDGHVVRQKMAYPVYDERYGANVAAVRDELVAAYPSLHLIGRNGMHKYNNQDHAMMTGMLTAENIVAGSRIHDVWRVNEDAEYLEAGPSGAREALASERLVPRRAA